MKRSLALTVFVTIVYIASAQQDAPQRMGGGGFTIGYGTMDVSKLQAFFPEGTRSFSNSQIVIGGTGHAFIGELVIGGSGYGIIGEEFHTDTARIGLGGGLGTFDLGHLVINKPKLKLFPTVGIGAGGYGVNITDNRNISVDDIITDPRKEIHVSNAGVVFDIALNMHFMPSITYQADDDSYGGFMVGWRIGYVYSPSNSNWMYSGGNVINGPDFGLNMLYVKLVIGGFGSKGKK